MRILPTNIYVYVDGGKSDLVSVNVDFHAYIMLHFLFFAIAILGSVGIVDGNRCCQTTSRKQDRTWLLSFLTKM